MTVINLSLPIRAESLPPGTTIKTALMLLGVSPAHRLVAGRYAGKFGYRVIRKHTHNTPPTLAA